MFWIYLLFLVRDFRPTVGDCRIPDELLGRWLTSNKGYITFTATGLRDFSICSHISSYCGDYGLTSNWTCLDNVDNKYMLRQTKMFYSKERFYEIMTICLDLHRLTMNKYVYYLAGQEYDDFVHDYAQYSIGIRNYRLQDLCYLSEPYPASRHSLMIRPGTEEAAKSICPPAVLGVFNAKRSHCNARIDFCVKPKEIIISNTNCDPKIFYNDGGDISCMHSGEDSARTYVTVYNKELTTHNFVCLCIVERPGEVVRIWQKYGDCNHCEFTSTRLPDLTRTSRCLIYCKFPEILQGDWTGNRKGAISIDADTIHGVDPSVPGSDSPIGFDCYLNHSNVYLARTAPFGAINKTHRMYMCLDLVYSSEEKIVYYNVHSKGNANLTILNSAWPVNEVTDVCFTNSYNAALHSILLPSNSSTFGAEPCPSDFRAVYKTTTSSCDYTIDSCHVETQINLSSTACSPSPFYTSEGMVSCVYSAKTGDTTYLTVYNHDAIIDDNSTFQFTCLAYVVSGDVLTFTQTPGGCHYGQNAFSVDTSNGAHFEFEFVEFCDGSTKAPEPPVSKTGLSSNGHLPSLIALAAGLLGLLLLICIFCSLLRKRLASGEELEF